MDLAHLREHPTQLPIFLTHQRIRETPVGGGDSCAAARLTLDDGASLFAKTWPAGTAPEGFFAAEAAGLRWLGESRAVAVPEVLVATRDLLALEWIEAGDRRRRRRRCASAGSWRYCTAAAHRRSAPTGPVSSASLPQDNTLDAGPWPQWFAQRRLLPYLRRSVDNGALGPADAALVERVVDRLGEYGGDEPPARIHGDLWPGNLLWAADGRVWLIDPAAHGGHRETDLADLALFGGAPYLDRILAGYQQQWPLADGWQARLPVHQLQLLLVHTAAFGAVYRDAVVRTAQAALSG